MALVEHSTREGSRVLVVRTGMNPRSFAQSRLSKITTVPGHLVDSTGQVDSWQFEGTFCDDTGSREEIVLFGTDYQGTPLIDLVQGTDKKLAWSAMHRCISLLEKVLQSGNQDLVLNAVRTGPAGILMGDNGGLLVFPAEACIACIETQPGTFPVDNRHRWIHPDADTLPPERSLSFLAGVMAYRIIAGQMPFAHTGEDAPLSQQIAETIRKHRYMELSRTVWEVRNSAAQCVDGLINTSLSNSTATLLAFGNDFDAICDPERAGQVPTAEFTDIRDWEIKRFNTAIKKAVFMKKYRVLYSGALVACCALLAFLAIWRFDSAAKPTTEGLDSSEVVLRYYTAISQLDQVTPRAFSKRRVKPDYDDFTASLYVSAKMRQTYERDAGIITPAQLYAGQWNKDKMVYGMTQLSVRAVSRGEKTAQYEVSFYLWLPFSPSPEDAPLDPFNAPIQLSLYLYRDIVNLEYARNRWIISAIEHAERTTIEENGQKVLDLVNNPEGKTKKWAPSNEEIENAQQFEMIVH